MEQENTPPHDFSLPLDNAAESNTRSTKRTSSFSSTDSFEFFNRSSKSASFASPNIPKLTRKQFESYGTLATPFADLNNPILSNDYHQRPRGRSEHLEQDSFAAAVSVTVGPEEQQAIAAGGGGTLSPYGADGRSIRRSVSHYDNPESSQLLRGDYQLRSSHSVGWADSGTPNTNQTRKLRELSTAFDQYVRTRRKVIFITCGMAAAFTFLCAMTSRMAGVRDGSDRSPAAAAAAASSSLESVASSSLTFSVSDKDTAAVVSAPSVEASVDASMDASTHLSANTTLAAWYLVLCYAAAAASCVGSFLCMWIFSLRKRVTLSLLLMLGPLVILILVETSTVPTWKNRPLYPEIVMVLAGTSWGMFLPTVLSMMTPHGKNTKLWLTLGIPFGNLVVEMLFVGAEGTTTQYGTNAVTITAGIAAACIVLGLCIHVFAIPNVHIDSNGDSIYAVCSALRNVCLWMRSHLFFGCIAVFISSACVSMFSVGAISMALEKHTTVSLFGNSSLWVVPEGLVMGVYACFGLIGSLMGRKMAYMVQTRNDSASCTFGTECIVRVPFSFALVTLSGGGVIAAAFKINWGVLIPLGVFLLGYGYAFLMNMLIRYVDDSLPKESNLAGYTLLIGASLGGPLLVWGVPVWVQMASWMGGS